MEKIKVKAILFDLWLTLASDKYYQEAGKSMESMIIEKLNLNKSFKEVEKVVDTVLEKDKKKYIEEVFRELGAEFKQNDVDFFVEVLEKKIASTELFADTIPSLKKLKEKKFKLGLITNSNIVRTPFVLNKSNLKDYFDSITLSYKLGKIKPDSALFEKALKELNVKPDETVMVGDSLQGDIIGAEKMGIKGILIKRGKEHWKETEGKPFAVISSLKELIGMVERK